AARDGSDAQLGPVQPRSPDLRRVEALRHRAIVRTALSSPAPLRHGRSLTCARMAASLRRKETTMLRIIAAALGALALAAPAGAQDWPTRPVTLVVPYAAGGPVDTIARIMAARLGEILGQQMVVENVGGAGGMTGAARVAKTAPDGYTVMLSGSAV